jgi:transcriptional regulator with XRE-family HTH domain
MSSSPIAERLPCPVGDLLKQWRAQRKLSQVSLAMEANISSRHLAFIEVGRAVPSREMVLRLGNALSLPFRERNQLLRAAGFAPEFQQTDLAAPEMEAVRRSFEFILEQHQPNPAALIDVNYNILMGNRPFESALEFFSGGLHKAAKPLNFLRLMFDKQGLRRSIVKPCLHLRRFIDGLRHRVIHCPSDEDAQDLLREALAFIPPEMHSGSPSTEELPPILVPLHLKRDGIEVRCFTVVTTLATASDITLQELQIESFFPADEESRNFFASISN